MRWRFFWYNFSMPHWKSVQLNLKKKTKRHILYLTILGMFFDLHTISNIKKRKYLECEVLIMHYRICELFFYDASESYKTETALVDAWFASCISHYYRTENNTYTYTPPHLYWRDGVYGIRQWGTQKQRSSTCHKIKK